MMLSGGSLAFPLIEFENNTMAVLCLYYESVQHSLRHAYYEDKQIEGTAVAWHPSCPGNIQHYDTSGRAAGMYRS